MKPEDRPEEAARIGELFSAEVRELGAAIRGPETDIHRGLARNPWLLLGLMSIALVVSGSLLGRLTDNDTREHEQFRKAIEDQGKWIASLDRRVESQETRLANYGDESRRALRTMEDMQRESYEFWKAAAAERGGQALQASPRRGIPGSGVCGETGTAATWGRRPEHSFRRGVWRCQEWAC